MLEQRIDDTHLPRNSIESRSSAGVTPSVAYVCPESSFNILASLASSWKCFLLTLYGLNSLR